jgi:hypothetical protein
MSLLNKTNNVLKVLKPNNYMELSTDYNNINLNENISESLYSSNISTNLKSNIININEPKNNINKNNYNYNYNYSNNFTDNIGKNIFNDNIISQDFSFKQSINDFNLNNSNSNSITISNSQDINFMNERFPKKIEERKHLKEKLFLVDPQKNGNKNSYKEIIEENSKLQLRIQKLIENETVTNDKYRNELNEKDKIINDLKNHIHNLKDKINTLSNENICLLKNIQNLNNKIMNLTNDKRILIEEMTELNKSLNNKIKPKLIQNEDYLKSLENQFVLLKKDNASLVENDKKQKSIISIFRQENKMLKKNIQNFNSVHSNEEFSIKKININHPKNKSKSINIRNHTNISNNNNYNNISNGIGNGIKKFPSCNSIKRAHKQRNRSFKTNRVIEHHRNSVNNNNIKNSKIFKTSSSDKNLDYINPVKGRNVKYNSITKRKNKSNSNWFRTLYMKNDYENGKIKANNNYLRFNTTIRKKEKSNNQNRLNINCNRTTKTKVSNFPIFDLNLKIKKQKKNEEETKDNYLIANQINKYNISQSRSYLSSYTEDL